MTTGFAPDRYVVDGKEFVLWRSHDQILTAVDKCAEQLSHRSVGYASGTVPLLICVLKGAVQFFADMIRRIDFDAQLEFVRASSYGTGTTPQGEPEISFVSDVNLAGRDVVLVEDIIDSGQTARLLQQSCQRRNAASCTLVSLLYKVDSADDGVVPEIYGMEVPDRFIIGYGLDYAERGRNLNALYIEDTSR